MYCRGARFRQTNRQPQHEPVRRWNIPMSGSSGRLVSGRFAEDFANGEAAERKLDSDDQIFFELIIETTGGIGATGNGFDRVSDIAKVVGKGQSSLDVFLAGFLVV